MGLRNFKVAVKFSGVLRYFQEGLGLFGKGCDLVRVFEVVSVMINIFFVERVGRGFRSFSGTGLNCFEGGGGWNIFESGWDFFGRVWDYFRSVEFIQGRWKISGGWGSDIVSGCFIFFMCMRRLRFLRGGGVEIFFKGDKKISEGAIRFFL